MMCRGQVASVSSDVLLTNYVSRLATSLNRLAWQLFDDGGNTREPRAVTMWEFALMIEQHQRRKRHNQQPMSSEARLTAQLYEYKHFL